MSSRCSNVTLRREAYESNEKGQLGALNASKSSCSARDFEAIAMGSAHPNVNCDTGGPGRDRIEEFENGTVGCTPRTFFQGNESGARLSTQPLLPDIVTVERLHFIKFKHADRNKKWGSDAINAFGQGPFAFVKRFHKLTISRTL